MIDQRRGAPQAGGAGDALVGEAFMGQKQHVGSASPRLAPFLHLDYVSGYVCSVAA
jgi:hypothetical protein